MALIRSKTKRISSVHNEDDILTSVSDIEHEVMQSYPARALDRRLQVDWAKDAKESLRVLMNLRIWPTLQSHLPMDSPLAPFNSCNFSKGSMTNSMTDFSILKAFKVSSHSPKPSKVTQVAWHPPWFTGINVILMEPHLVLRELLCVEWSTLWLECDSSFVVLAFKDPSIMPWRLRNRWLNCLTYSRSMSFQDLTITHKLISSSQDGFLFKLCSLQMKYWSSWRRSVQSQDWCSQVLWYLEYRSGRVCCMLRTEGAAEVKAGVGAADVEGSSVGLVLALALLAPQIETVRSSGFQQFS
ncbi:hypothetical protein D0Y65_026579 [Glycine soja]|uniref:Uncharacterized protein n=1 Tax=Glycine soja TaxID=3848 RepID=A0A445IKK2_GLYSO|nr:hypothetical protein D0Y65_026579 [Glycine soja]